MNEEIKWPHAVNIVSAYDTEPQGRLAASIVLALVNELADDRRNVVLVDLTGPNSVLAKELNVESDEGVEGVLVRGVLFSRVVQSPKRHSFYFLPAGRTRPPASSFAGSRVWDDIGERFRKAGCFLVLHVSTGRKSPLPRELGVQASIFVNFTGRTITVPGALARVDVPPARQSNVDDETISAILASALEEISIEPGSARWRRGRPRFKRPGSGRLVERAALVAFGAPLILLMIVSFLYPDVPALLGVGSARTATADAREKEDEATEERTAAASASPSPVAPQGEPAPAKPESEPQSRPSYQNRAFPYSVQIAAYNRFEDAVRKQRELADPNWSLYVIPAGVQGRIIYRLMAGPFPDKGRAESVNGRLARRGIKPAASWDVRPTGYAFALRTFADEALARAEIETLGARRVPAYSLPVAAAGGGIGYRVYVGGYDTSAEAEAARRRLAEAGWSATWQRLEGLHATSPTETARDSAPASPTNGGELSAATGN